MAIFIHVYNILWVLGYIPLLSPPLPMSPPCSPRESHLYLSVICMYVILYVILYMPLLNLGSSNERENM